VIEMTSVPQWEGPAAIPRREGAPVFETPWQARAFALAVELHERGAYRWDDFQQSLIREIAAAEAARPDENSGEHYYERWLAALEKLLVEKNILTGADLDH
jgi:nitrile hydratase accessory protein